MPPQGSPAPKRFSAFLFRHDLIVVTLLGMVLMAAYSVYLGKDVNYDLLNYHYYGCYCLSNGRIGFDVYAAQFGSFLNPVSYLPFCWAVNHLTPIAVGILFGAIAGLSLGLLYALTRTALSGAMPGERNWLALLTAVAGVCSPMFLALVGTSFSDSWTPLLILLGLFAVMHDAESPSWRLTLLAGLMVGLTAGFKLVNGVYVIAMFLTLCVAYQRTDFVRRIAGFCVGAAGAILAAGGLWALAIFREFRNPFFPFYNHIFKSPLYAPVEFSDPRWKATTLAGAFEKPLQWALGHGDVSSEAPFRDLRFAIFVALLLPALAVVVFRWYKPKVAPQPGASDSWFRPAHRNIVLWFFTLSYLLWLYTFGHQRYGTPLELLSSLAVLAVCDALIGNRRVTRWVFVVLALVSIGWIRVADWGRRPWDGTWFETTITKELRLSNTLYVIPDSMTSAFLIPMLPADSRFVRIESNGRPLPPDRWLGPRVQAIIQHHTGPLRILEGENFNLTALAGYGVSVNRDDCLKVRTYANVLTVCSAYRTADGARSATQLVRRQELARLVLPQRLRRPDADPADEIAGWTLIGPPAHQQAGVHPRGASDNPLTLTLRPPESARQLSGEVRFIPDRDNASVLVDVIWHHGSTEISRTSPSINVGAAGRETFIPILADRPREADSVEVTLRPWRVQDGVATAAGGYLIWSRPD